MEILASWSSINWAWHGASLMDHYLWSFQVHSSFRLLAFWDLEKFCFVFLWILLFVCWVYTLVKKYCKIFWVYLRFGLGEVCLYLYYLRFELNGVWPPFISLLYFLGEIFGCRLCLWMMAILPNHIKCVFGKAEKLKLF